MHEQDSIRKLGLTVMLILAGSAWTVSSYLASRDEAPEQQPLGSECADCPELDAAPIPDSFTSLYPKVERPDAG